MGSVSHVEEAKKNLVKVFHRLARFGVWSEDSANGGFMVHHNCQLSLVVEVMSKWHLDESLINLRELILCKLSDSLSLGVMGFWGITKGCVCPMLMTWEIEFLRKVIVPVVPFIWAWKRCIVTLKKCFRREGFKWDIEEFVAKCPNC